MIDRHFDDILRDKLHSMRIEQDADWSVFSAKLDLALQSDEIFDQSVEHKLASFDTTALTPDWDKFAQKLENQQSFDDAVNQKLHQIDTSRVSEHWLLLKDRLEQILALKERMFSIKIFESFLIIASLLTFVNISPWLLNKPSSQMVETQTQINKPDNTTNLLVDSLEEQPEIIPSEADNTPNTSYIKEPISTKRVTIPNAVRQVEKQSTIIAPPAITSNNAQAQKRARSHSSSLIPVSTPEEKEQLAASADIDKIALHALPEQSPTIKSDKEVAVVAEHPRLHFHALTGITNTFVYSKLYADQYPGKYSYFNRTPSITMGLLGSIDMKHLSLETGLLFSQRKFEDNSPNTLTERLISIPINIKVSTDQYKKWSVYALAGLQGSIMSRTTFNELAKSKSIDYTYASVNGGIGLQHRFSKYGAIYAQANYAHHLTKDGIGTAGFHYDQIGLNLGIKVIPFNF